MEYDYLIKLLLVGSREAGKTQLQCRYADDTFSESYIATPTLEFKIRTVDIDGKIVKVQVWEQGGRNESTTNYRGAHAIGICFDLCDANEFERLAQWLQQVDRYARENVPVFIIGTKCEQFTRITVDYQTIRNFCSLRKIKYFECSAKLNINVEDLFDSMIRKAVKQIVKSNQRIPSNVVVEKQRAKPKKKCAYQ